MVSIERRKSALRIAWVFALAIALAVLILGLRYFRPPGFLRGERHRNSPVLKPADLGDRSFFLRDGRYFLRLDSGQPGLTWTFDRAVQGPLRVGLIVEAKKTPELQLEFTITAVAPTGGRRRLASDILRSSVSESIERTFRAEVSLPAGAKIEFAAVPETPDVWAAIHAGMTVPMIETAPVTAKPSHLLIISIDALRSDYIGIYRRLTGHPQAQSFSPVLDHFAEDAAVFLNARTPQSSTWPALTSLFLSAYPIEHGTTRNGQFLEAAGTSIASLLRGRGYATAALLANGSTIHLPGFEQKRHLFGDGVLLKNAVRKIAGQASAPFFHWYHLWGSHDNYEPPEWVMKIIEKENPRYRYRIYRPTQMMSRESPCTPEEIAAVRRLYAGTVYHVDSLLGTLFGELKGLGIWDDTMVIVTADHGEELYDHHQYFYHNPSLYDASLKVPLLIKFPHQRGRRVIEENVSLVDILPTVYDYFVGPVPQGRFSGLSLIPLLKGQRKAFHDRFVFAEAEDSRVVAAVRDRYKLIYNPNDVEGRNRLGLPFPFARKELYDLKNDPGETRNLADSGHSAVGPLLAAADRYLRETRQEQVERTQEKVELSEEEKKETERILRSLGYIR